MALKEKNVKRARRKGNTLKGWAVVRVSKENEAKDGSPVQQINAIKDWVGRQRERTGRVYDIVRYVVEDGKSGRYQNTHRRKEILELAELVRLGAIDFIVNERLDRFSRDEVLNIQIMRDARRNGVELHEVNYGRFDPNDRGQRMAWKFRNIEAGEYSEGVSENVTRKQRSAMVFNGKDASPCPVLGLDYHERYVGFYKINRDELGIFEDIAKKFIELGYSRSGTLRYCNEKGYTTKVWWTREKIKNGEKVPPRKMGGKPFDWKSLLNTLGSPKIRGCNAFFDDWNQFPEKQDADGWVRWEYWHRRQYGPLFGEDLFRRIDAGLEKIEYRSRENEFPLSGIIRAPDGSRYTGESAKGGRHFYYRNRKLKKRFPVAQVHGAVFSRLKEIVREGGLLEGIVSRFGGGGAGRSRFDGERRRLRAKIGRLGEVVDGFGDALKAVVLEKRDDLGEVVGTLKDERGKAERDIRKLAGDLARLDGEERGFDESLKGGGFRASAKLLLDNMEKMPALQLRQVLKVLMPKIVVVTGQGENTLEITYNLAGCGAKKPGILPAVSGIRTAEDESSTYTEDGGA